MDLVRAQDVGLTEASDPDVLAWAAREGRIVVTHDLSTLVGFAYERVRTGQPMPGVIEVGRRVPTGRAIDDLLLLAEASLEREWDGQVVYLPL